MFIVDEAYYEFASGTAQSLVTEYPNVVVTRTFSKAFGLASFRIGYCLAHHSVISGLSKIRNPSISAMAQIAATAALADITYMENYVQEVKLSRAEVVEALNSLKLETVAGNANFILVKLSDDLRQPYSRLLKSTIFMFEILVIASS